MRGLNQNGKKTTWEREESEKAFKYKRGGKDGCRSQVRDEYGQNAYYRGNPSRTC